LAWVVVVAACFTSIMIGTLRPGSKKVDLSSPAPLVLALGDSITHGLVSHDWVGDMRLAYPSIAFINTGVCAHTSYRVLQTARATQLHKPPELVVIMVGTNDALSMLSPLAHKFYHDQGHLPDDAPTSARGALSAYARNLGATISHAKRVLRAKKVVVVSPPPLGNGRVAAELPKGTVWGDLAQHPSEMVRRVARQARLVALRHGAAYIDLHGELLRRLLRHPHPGPTFNPVVSTMLWQFVNAMCVKYLPGMTFNRVSWYPFMHDLIHLNQRGAQVLTDGLVPWLSKIDAAGARAAAAA
jgi:lysophospholipase L1-like esterase